VEGNCVVKRFRANNVVIPNIVTVTTASVDIAIPADPRVTTDAIGFAVPVDANFTNAVGINPCRATSNVNLRLRFVNAANNDINPGDTFDFDIILFLPTGANAVVIP
jgi:hypothetical protein